MSKKELILSHIKEIQELYNKNKSYTVTAQEFCKKREITYSDKWRRRIGDILSNPQTPELPITKHNAKILVFDIETAPIVAYVWGGWKQNPAANTQMIIEDWFIFTWSAKWLFDDKIMTGKLTPQEAIDKNDKRIVKDLWQLLEEADVVIAHNAFKFDIKKVNTRFLQWGLTPPMPYQVIDTLVHVRKQFSNVSNKLDWVAQKLGLEGKMKHSGFSLWDKCYNGDKDALDEMELYNIKDIKVLEEVYLHLRPWISPHPNVGLFVGNNIKCCSACGSEKLQETGEYSTYANTYSAMRCGDCGSISRSRKALTNMKNNSKLTLSTPK